MWLDLSYSEARNRYPEHVAQVISNFRKGKSKFKSTPPELMAWGLDWCVQIDGGNSLEDLLSGNIPKAPELTEDEDVADYANRCSVSLGAKVGKSTWYSAKLATPLEILNQYRKCVRERNAEAARFAALTPAEQDAETQKALKQLRGSPGFFEL